MRSRRSVLTATAAVIGTLVVAACGGSSNTSDRTRTIVETRTVTQSVTSSTTSTGPLTNTTATQATTTKPISNACSASDLTPVYLGSNGAAGTIVLGFALKNTGSATCHTYGWPGVQFLSSSGAALPTGSKRTTADVVGSTPANALTLAPGEEASFRMVTSDMGPNGSSCPTAADLQIYAPDDTVKMKVSVAGVAACGQTTVSPLMPGASAFAGQGGGGGGAGQAGLSGSGSGSGGSGSGGSGSNGSSTTNGGSGLSSS